MRAKCSSPSAVARLKVARLKAAAVIVGAMSVGPVSAAPLSAAPLSAGPGLVAASASATATATAVGVAAPPATQAVVAVPRVAYRPPVVGTVVDPYRPPTTPYGPGNRGIDLASPPGSVVVAPADGVVTFAGQVGGRLFVVVLHADGVRTTMAQLATVTVTQGQRVSAGQQVGTSAGRIHFGARVGTQYIDPSLLLATGRVRLVR